MEADLQSFIAFYLTGKIQRNQLDEIGELKLRPALFAGHRDLTRMRYDYPLILVSEPANDRFVEPLSGLIDAILAKVASGRDGDRIRKHVLRLEQEIRALVAQGAKGNFSELWAKAAPTVGGRDKTTAELLARARANLTVDGPLIDCAEGLAFHLLGHAWSIAQRQRAQRFDKRIDRLILKLSEILQADFVNSDAGKSAEKLKASFGTGPLDSFDFDAMSRILKKASAHQTLPKRRRQRIHGLISTLQSQRFYPTTLTRTGAGKTPYSFAFETCSEALKAYRDRLPKAIELAKAIAIAELEIKGEYNEGRHDPLFKSFGENGLDVEELAIFPDYLVCLNATTLSGPEQSTLTEILSADLPIKIVVQTDDILEQSLIERGHLAFTLRSKQLARMAMGMGVFVLQAPGSSLYEMREELRQGLQYGGTALFSIFSGASANTAAFPPYLVGAAARESRLFPAFSFNPAAGNTWAARFSLKANPQLDNDWPTHNVVYQDERMQTVALPQPFTLIDFVACDARYAGHFARVPRTSWNDSQTPVATLLANENRRATDSVPYLLMVDADNCLQRVLVDEKLIREARRCRTMWNSLQELGGIHNSHAEQLLAKEREKWESVTPATSTNRGETPIPATPPTVQPAATAPAVVEAETERSTDEAYIETPRCSTCNECVQLNGKMFAYDGNKQAYIADPSAGTFAQLVEAAENCQVSIIHPGKPRNPNEPGLEELLKRAELFA